MILLPLYRLPALSCCREMFLLWSQASLWGVNSGSRSMREETLGSSGRSVGGGLEELATAALERRCNSAGDVTLLSPGDRREVAEWKHLICAPVHAVTADTHYYANLFLWFVQLFTWEYERGSHARLALSLSELKRISVMSGTESGLYPLSPPLLSSLRTCLRGDSPGRGDWLRAPVLSGSVLQSWKLTFVLHSITQTVCLLVSVL